MSSEIAKKKYDEASGNLAMNVMGTTGGTGNVISRLMRKAPVKAKSIKGGFTSKPVKDLTAIEESFTSKPIGGVKTAKEIEATRLAHEARGLEKARTGNILERNRAARLKNLEKAREKQSRSKVSTLKVTPEGSKKIQSAQETFNTMPLTDRERVLANVDDLFEGYIEGTYKNINPKSEFFEDFLEVSDDVRGFLQHAGYKTDKMSASKLISTANEVFSKL